MGDDFQFQFEMPPVPVGPLVELSPQETEKMLLKSLAEAKADPRAPLWQLAQFYKLTRQHNKAIQRLRELIVLLPDPEAKANCIFTMGQAMEAVSDYPAAVRYYKEAMTLEPTHTFTWYFINNNLGFSLNTLRQFQEGEFYCRQAISIDPNRPNGHKNLGIALVGQEKLREAAESFVKATQANAADSRAFRLLEELLSKHPELRYDFLDDEDSCREAVKMAAQHMNASQPIILRGWRKRLFLLRAKCRAFVRRLRSSPKPTSPRSQ